jgi:hypothetical protein
MTTSIRAQLLSLRTVPSTFVVALAAVALVAVLTFVDLTELAQVGSATAPELCAALLGVAGSVCAVLLVMFTAAKSAGEYRHGTMARRLLAEPRRLRLLTATIAGHTVLALVTTVVALAAAVAVAVPLLAGTGPALGLTTPMLLAAVLAVTLFGVLGSAVGVICRSQAAALSVLVGWFAAEKILAGFLGDVSAYLPFALLNPLFGVEGGPVSMGTAAVVLTVTTAAVTAVAAVLFQRRDVS